MVAKQSAQKCNLSDKFVASASRARALIAVNRANALNVENFPAALFLPARIARRPDLNLVQE